MSAPAGENLPFRTDIAIAQPLTRKEESNEACTNQAFVYGSRTVALQFHIESTAESVGLLLTNCGNEIAGDQPCIQSVEEIRSQKQYLPHVRELLFRLLDAMEKDIPD